LKELEKISTMTSFGALTLYLRRKLQNMKLFISGSISIKSLKEDITVN